jgi:TM2 domain-containing membrane protein YozV
LVFASDKKQLERQIKFMKNYTTNTSDKSKKTALIVCLIGELIGLHYFYVGRIATGLVRLITLNIFGIGWIIDLITIALAGFRDNVGAPLRA